MKPIQARNGFAVHSALLMALLGLTIAGVVLADLMVTNAAGVRAGITGIVRVSTNQINVQYAVQAPTSTNVTTFVIERSSNLVAWGNFSPTVTWTGSTMGAVSDFATPTSQFYRMRLIDF